MPRKDARSRILAYFPERVNHEPRFGLTDGVSANALRAYIAGSSGSSSNPRKTSISTTSSTACARSFKDHEAISENKDFVPRSASDPNFTKGLPAESSRRLKASGILNQDGSIRIDTAERLGWTKVWEEREQAKSQTSAVRAGIP